MSAHRDQPPAQPARRRVIWLGAGAGLAAGFGPLTSAVAQGNPVRPKPGDWLAVDDTEGKPVALTLADVRPGKPVLAYPFEPAAAQARSDSRLNKVVLVRVAETDLDAASRALAAGGVLAFSAVCTHQACDVKTWIAADKSLVCFCHASRFMPLEGARVAAGPAPRALPALPLKLDGERLVVAGTFSTPPGSAA